VSNKNKSKNIWIVIRNNTISYFPKNNNICKSVCVYIYIYIYIYREREREREREFKWNFSSVLKILLARINNHQNKKQINKQANGQMN
jgi:hypothetical protein